MQLGSDLCAFLPHPPHPPQIFVLWLKPSVLDMDCGGYSPTATVLRAARLLRLLTFLRLERRVKGIKRMAFVLHDTHAELWMTMFLTMVRCKMLTLSGASPW